MSTLKGLTKSASPAPSGQDADAFIAAAKVHSNTPKPPRTVRAKRVNLSLDEQSDATIDRLSLLPRDFKASRSDVVKAAVALLATYAEDDVIELLRNVSN